MSNASDRSSQHAGEGSPRGGSPDRHSNRSSTVTLSDADGPLHAAPVWDAADILRLHNPATEAWTCVGHATSLRRRCQRQIAGRNIDGARNILRRLGRMDLRPREPGMEQLLRDLADRMLCPRDHRTIEQRNYVVQTWQNRIRRLRGQRQEGEGQVPSVSPPHSRRSHPSSSSGSSSPPSDRRPPRQSPVSNHGSGVATPIASGVRNSPNGGSPTPRPTPRMSPRSTPPMDNWEHVQLPPSPTWSYMSLSSSYISPTTLPSSPSFIQNWASGVRNGQSEDTNVRGRHRIFSTNGASNPPGSFSSGRTQYRSGLPTPPTTPHSRGPEGSQAGRSQTGYDTRMDELETQVREMRVQMEAMARSMERLASVFRNGMNQ